MKKCYFSFFFLLVIFLNFSCKKPDITPAFLLLTEEDFKDCIQVDNFNQVHDTNYDIEELNVIKQQNFRDVLVSINGKELGYWQLPCRIPLLPNYSGKNNIRIIPCVRVPNISLSATPYLFLTPIEQFFEMEKEGEYRWSNIKFEYTKGVNFPILETFSQTTLFKPLDTLFNTPLEIDKEMNVGKIALEDSMNFFNVVTPFYTLNGHGERQFWEMSYKCEFGEMVTYLDFKNAATGVFHQDLIVLPATTGWKKVYINLSDVISWACGPADKLLVRFGISGYTNPDYPKATFYFDNIKIITMYAPY